MNKQTDEKLVANDEDVEQANETDSTVKVVVIEAEQVFKENADDFHESNAATVQVAEEKEAEKALTENVVKPVVEETVVEEIVVEEISDEVCNDAEYLEGSQKSLESDRVVIVHAVASFESSPSDNLNQEDVNPLEKYIFSEKHLTDNISKVEFFIQSKWEISVKIHVVTTKLWEGPRQYIWKHLGASNFWNRGNGTKIRLSRIHVK